MKSFVWKTYRPPEYDPRKHPDNVRLARLAKRGGVEKSQESVDKAMHKDEMFYNAIRYFNKHFENEGLQIPVMIKHLILNGLKEQITHSEGQIVSKVEFASHTALMQELACSRFLLGKKATDECIAESLSRRRSGDVRPVSLKWYELSSYHKKEAKKAKRRAYNARRKLALLNINDTDRPSSEGTQSPQSDHSATPPSSPEIPVAKSTKKSKVKRSVDDIIPPPNKKAPVGKMPPPRDQSQKDNNSIQSSPHDISPNGAQSVESADSPSTPPRLEVVEDNQSPILKDKSNSPRANPVKEKPRKKHRKQAKKRRHVKDHDAAQSQYHEKSSHSGFTRDSESPLLKKKRVSHEFTDNQYLEEEGVDDYYDSVRAAKDPE